MVDQEFFFLLIYFFLVIFRIFLDWSGHITHKWTAEKHQCYKLRDETEDQSHSHDYILQKEVLFKVISLIGLWCGCEVKDQPEYCEDIDQKHVDDQNELHYFKVQFTEQETDTEAHQKCIDWDDEYWVAGAFP